MSLLLLAALTACTEDLAARGAYLTGPEAFVWEGEGFHVSGQRKMKGSASLSEGELVLWFHGFPPGTEVSLGESVSAADEVGYGELRIDASPAFGRVRVSELVSTQWTTAELHGIRARVTPPGGQPFEVPLPTETVYYPTQPLREGIVRGPVLYEGESAGDGPLLRAYLFDGSEHKVFGDPATLADLDAVALVTRSTLGQVVCDGYEREDGTPAPDVLLERQDARVDLYGRRSGKIIASHTFPPVEDRCPESLLAYSEGQQKRGSSLPREAIAEWLGAQLPTQ